MLNPRFQTIKFLGRGGQGFVQLAYDNLHKERVAIKYIDRGWSREFYKYVLRETLNHQQLSLCKHPHIVEFHEVFLTPSYLAVVMEYVNGTNLQQYLEGAGGKLPEDVGRFIFQQLVIAVDFCHKKGKVNRDIKLANILLQEGHLPLVKLCDFGFSKDKFDDSEPQTQIGTALFTAPEIFTNVPGQVYDAEAADVWSCGVVLFVMLFGCHPFLSLEDTQQRKHAQVMKLIENAVRGSVQVPPSAEELYPQALDLVCRILVSAPSQRCKLPAIMEHPWFQDKLPPGALLLNAAYLSMEHPVGELRQTPEEVHAIITAALPVSAQDKKSDCNSPALTADMAAVLGQSSWQQQQQLQTPLQPDLQQTQLQQAHFQQTQPPQTQLQTQLVGQPVSPKGSTITNPLSSQQGLMHHHHPPHHQHHRQPPASMLIQSPGHSPAVSAAVQMHAHVHVQAQHAASPSHHPQLAQHGHGQSSPLTLPPTGVQHSVVKPKQPLLMMAMDVGSSQQSGSNPASSSSYNALAVAGPPVGASSSMQAATAAVPAAMPPQMAPQHSVSSDLNSLAMRFHPRAPLAMANPATQQLDVPPSTPMNIRMDGLLRKSSGSVQLAGSLGTGQPLSTQPLVQQRGAPTETQRAGAATAGTARAGGMGMGGCVLYDSSLLYNLDLQTED